MKKLALIIVFALSFGIILTSCDKENSTNVNKIDGTYTGTYTTTNKTRNSSWTTTPTIELKNGKYTYKGLFEKTYYANGSGDYTIQGNKIIFKLKKHDIPDDVLIEHVGVIEESLLQGEYSYEFDEKELILFKTYPIVEETYHSLFEMKKD